MQHAWQLIESLAIRTTGFPIELVERLRSRRTVALVQELLECEHSREQQRLLLLRQAFREAVARVGSDRSPAGRALLHRLSSWRRAVGHGQCVQGLEQLPAPLASLAAQLTDWNALQHRWEALYLAGSQAWQEERAQAGQTLRALATDQRFQEALWLSSPQMYQALLRSLQEQESRTARSFERRLMLYLQRLCAKNETQSFFGPINYGRLAPQQQANLHLQRSQRPLRQRTTFASHWLAEALAAKIGSEPALRPFLHPRRGTLCFLQDGSLHFPATRTSLALDERSARLFALADGTLTLQSLAEHLQEPWTETWKRVQQLRRQHALLAQLLIPPQSAQPLLALIQWLQEIPVEPARRWLSTVQQLADCIEALANADLQERCRLLTRLEAGFVEAVGAPARRGNGSMYADRLLFFEECLGDIEECGLGGSLARQIDHGLQPVLDLAYHYARLRARRDLHQAQQVLQGLPASQEGTPLLAYLQAMARGPQLTRQPDALDRFLSDLQELVRQHSDGRVARLRAADLPLTPGQGGEAGLCTSFDLMIAASDQESLAGGAFQLVLGEMHPYPLLQVFPSAYFATQHPGPWSTTLKQALQRLADAQPLPVQPGFTRKSKIFPYPLPGPTLELRPRAPTCEAIPAALVSIQESESGLCLQAEGRQLRLYAPITRRAQGPDALAALSFPALELPPISLGAYTPRIEIEQVVYQRAQWVLEQRPGSGSEQEFARFLAIWRQKTQLGLPDEVFVRATGEPKPIYLDFTCMLSVEVFDMLARQSEQLVLTEMWPDTRHLWLRGAQGRHTCEFRLLALAAGLDGGECLEGGKPPPLVERKDGHV